MATTDTQPSDSTTLNLSVLRRYVPTTHSIIAIAPYSVLYIFRPALSAWEKSGIEGTLFILRLETLSPGQECYALFILNRRGLDNFIMPLKTPCEVQLSDEYLIVQEDVNGEEERVWGIWIFEEGGGSTAGVRERVGRVVLECAGRVEQSAGRDMTGEGVDGQGDGGLSGEADGHEEEATQHYQHPSLRNADGGNLMALLHGIKDEHIDISMERSVALD